jgi:hypothetical protein
VLDDTIGNGEKGGVGLEGCRVGGTGSNLDLRIELWKNKFD